MGAAQAAPLEVAVEGGPPRLAQATLHRYGLWYTLSAVGHEALRNAASEQVVAHILAGGRATPDATLGCERLTGAAVVAGE
eukprot:14286400-Alexandrium_andersonii.AAC.1